MAHNDIATMAVAPWRRNRVTVQRSTAIDDFDLADAERPHRLGAMQGLGKLRGGMLTATARWAPEGPMRTFADRSLDGWPVSEDPPDPDDRVTVDPDGHIRPPYTPNNLKAHGEFVAVWSRHMRALGRPIIVTQEMDIKVAMHRCATARFGTDPRRPCSTRSAACGTSTTFTSSTHPFCRPRRASTRRSPSWPRRFATAGPVLGLRQSPAAAAPA